jgi:Cys-tRNA(Pro)/Cys-tRNA(Cys) deacylase
MKKVAAGFGGKQAEMMKPDKAERLTGYRVGGISPFGQKRAVPTAFDAAPMTAPKVWINAGMRGLLLGIAPQDALRVAQGLSFGLTP